MATEGNGGSRDGYSVELRAELLNIFSGGDLDREGESDHLEIGLGGSLDYVEGDEDIRVGGDLTETTGKARTTISYGNDIRVDGFMTLSGRTETTMLGGGIRESHFGPEFLAAGMTDDLVAGAGARVTFPADTWLCGLFTREENIGVAAADGVLLEAYGMALDHELYYGMHNIGTTMFSGLLYHTQATGFRGLIRSHAGVSNIVFSAGGSGSSKPPAGGTPPPAGDPTVAANATLGTMRSGASINEAEDTRFLVDAALAAEDVAQTVPELEGTRLVDGAQYLDYANVLDSADEFLASDEATRFFQQGDEVAEAENATSVGEDAGTLVRSGEDADPSGGDIYSKPSEHSAWNDEQLKMRQNAEPVDGPVSIVPPPPPPILTGDTLTNGDQFLPQFVQLDYDIADLDALRIEALDNGDTESAESLGSAIEFLRSVQEELNKVDEAGNPIHASATDALNVAFDEYTKTADSDDMEFIEELRDKYSQAWDDQGAPSPGMNQVMVPGMQPPEFGTGGPPPPSPPSPTDADPDALWGPYAVSQPIGPTVGDDSGGQTVVDNLFTTGFDPDKLDGLNNTPANANPLQMLDEGYGSSGNLSGDPIYEEIPALTGSTGSLASSDEGDDTAAATHALRVDTAGDLTQSGNTGEDAGEAEKISAIIGPPEEDGSNPVRIQGTTETGELPPPGRVIDGQVSPVDPDLLGDPIYDEVPIEHVDPIYDQARPENVSANYGELAGNPAPTWNSQSAPTINVETGEEAIYDDIRPRFIEGTDGWQGSVWKGDSTVVSPPTDFSIERALYADELPAGTDTTELIENWRSMQDFYTQQADDLASRGPGYERQAAAAQELADIYGDMADRLASGDFSLRDLLDLSKGFESRAADMKDPQAASTAQVLLGMIEEYDDMIENALGWRADEDWIEAVANLDAAKASGNQDEILAANKALTELFDENFPPPSWLDGQRPSEDLYDDNLYAAYNTETRTTYSGKELHPADPSKKYVHSTITMAAPEGTNVIVIDKVEKFDLIELGQIQVQVRGNWTDEHGNVINVLTQNPDDPTDIGGMYTIVLAPDLQTPSAIDDMDEFLANWRASASERSSRIDLAAGYVEEGADQGGSAEIFRSLVENLPEGSGSLEVVSEKDEASELVTYTLVDRPTTVDPDSGADSDEVAKYFSDGAGRGNTTIENSDVNAPILDDPIYTIGNVRVETVEAPASAGLDNIAGTADETITAGQTGVVDETARQRTDLMFGNPLADSDDVNVEHVMETDSTAQRTIAAQDPEVPGAKLEIGGEPTDQPSEESLYQSVGSFGEQSGDTTPPDGGGNTRIVDHTYEPVTHLGLQGNGGSNPIYDRLVHNGGPTPTGGLDPIYDLSGPIYDELVPQVVNKPVGHGSSYDFVWFGHIYGNVGPSAMLVPSSSQVVRAAPEPQLLEWAFLLMFRGLTLAGRVADDVPDEEHTEVPEEA